ncbi:MAG: prolipoprotein diacylglyceryl transferase [Bacteroidales bacterium]|nr:prolipoprotein diacylglyceryl transferase [Candidatus Egerieousia equi]
MLAYIDWNVDPVLFSIGSLKVRYYGLLFVSGFILGYFMFKSFFKREKLPVSLLDPLLYLLIFCTLIGARLGHVLFYQPGWYLAHPGEILKVWEGGLASHGGAIGILIGIVWFVKKYGRRYDFDYLWVMDRLAIAVPFAGMFIRLGNLMNSEIYGNPTDLPWGFIFHRCGKTVPMHPTQLYEAGCYLIAGVIMVLLYKYAASKLRRGFLFGLFLVLIFGARFAIEFVKLPQVAFEQGMPLDMGQLLSIPFILAGIWLMVRKTDLPALLPLPAEGVNAGGRKH